MEEEAEPAEKDKKEQSVRRQEKDVLYYAPHTENALIRKELSVLPNADERSKKRKFKS